MRIFMYIQCYTGEFNVLTYFDSLIPYLVWKDKDSVIEGLV